MLQNQPNPQTIARDRVARAGKPLRKRTWQEMQNTRRRVLKKEARRRVFSSPSKENSHQYVCHQHPSRLADYGQKKGISA